MTVFYLFSELDAVLFTISFEIKYELLALKRRLTKTIYKGIVTFMPFLKNIYRRYYKKFRIRHMYFLGFIWERCAS